MAQRKRQRRLSRVCAGFHFTQCTLPSDKNSHLQVGITVLVLRPFAITFPPFTCLHLNFNTGTMQIKACIDCNSTGRQKKKKSTTDIPAWLTIMQTVPRCCHLFCCSQKLLDKMVNAKYRVFPILIYNLFPLHLYG